MERHLPALQQKSPSLEVLEVVAARDGVDPLELPPLYETVDPEALDRLAASGVEIEFPYHGYDVRIRGGNEVTARSGDPARI